MHCQLAADEGGKKRDAKKRRIQNLTNKAHNISKISYPPPEMETCLKFDHEEKNGPYNGFINTQRSVTSGEV